MSKIGDLRAGLKANLDAIAGINVSRYARSNPVGPIIHLWPTSIVYHRAHQMGMSEVTFRVEAAVPFTEDMNSQALLDKLLDAEGEFSVRAAVEADPTLGGECDQVRVVNLEAYEVSISVDNQPRLVAAWAVTVLL